MKLIVNYLYSLIIRSSTNEKGEQHNNLVRKSVVIIMFGIGGLINLIIYPFFNDNKILIIGFIISPFVWIIYYLLVGFKYLDSVKKMDQLNASIILFFIAIACVGLFFVPVGIHLLIK